MGRISGLHQHQNQFPLFWECPNPNCCHKYTLLQLIIDEGLLYECGVCCATFVVWKGWKDQCLK